MKEEKRKKIVLMVSLILLFITIIGVTYAAFQYTKRGTKENELSTGTVSFVYNETSNGVTLTNAYPLSDSEGKNLTEATEEDNGYFDFNVTSTLGGDITIPYYVYAVDITGDVENKLSEDYVKVYLTDQEDQPLEKYSGEVPLYSDLDDINAQSKEGQEVQGKLLYQNEFTESGVHKYRLRIWVADTYKNSDKAETFKMRVDVNTEAEVVPKDQNKPTCEILNANPTTASRDEDITMTIKCTDDNGTVTSNMTKENVHVLVNNEEVEPTKKELTEGIAATEVTGENGIQHNLTLSGFEKDGPLSIKIDSGVVTDQYKNTNDEQELSTNVKIAKRINITYEMAGGVQSVGEESNYCDIKEGDTCNIELPEITVKEGYTGSFWSTEETAKEGKSPSTSIQVNADDTYYARGTKLVNVTYTKTSGVSSLTKDSDSCTRYGDEETCEVTLPTITGNKGYDQTYWGANNNTEYASRIESTTVTPADTTTYYAFAKDIKAPVCTLYSTTPTSGNEVKQDETVKIVVNCTDNSGTLANNLTKGNISVTYDGTSGTADTTVDSGTTITNGKKYTITLTNFSGTGVLAATIKEGAIKDASNNQMVALPITTGITIKLSFGVKNLVEKSNALDKTYSNGNKNEMFEFNQPDGSTAYRYIGDDPYNYVKMNDDNSIWRIIGVFNDPDSTGSKTQQRIKLIKDQSIKNIAWDTSNSNNWSKPATIRTDLNSGSTYSSLSATLKGKIEQMKWYLGGYDFSSPYSTENIFNQERGSKGGLSSPSTTTWNGFVGLMYPSDYGYTYAKGVSNCYTDFYNKSSTGCDSTNASKGWIRKGHESEYQWTITPLSSGYANVFAVYSDGYVSDPEAQSLYLGARPVVYLKSGTSFSGGSGTSGDPYILK